MKTELNFHGPTVEVEWYYDPSDASVGKLDEIMMEEVIQYLDVWDRDKGEYAQEKISLHFMFDKFDMWDDLEDKLIAKLEELRMEAQEADEDR